MQGTGEGSGNPLQHSCLENPRDGGAWRATVPGTGEPGGLQSQGQRSLVGYSPWGCEELDTTEQLTTYTQGQLCL